MIQSTDPRICDPVAFCDMCWPHVKLYEKQREILYSVRDNDDTIVKAGNMLGKDFVAAIVALWFFLTRHPCRIVTTSADGTQLEAVLWGEVRRFLQESKVELPIIKNHLHLRKIYNGEVCGLSYMIGRVAAKGEGMLGHHIAKTGDGIPRTLAMFDEASGVDNNNWEVTETWADRRLAIGNPFPCTNFFYLNDKAGSVKSPDKKRYYRKLIHIRAEHSPNVQLGLRQEARGLIPDNQMLIDGVISYEEYEKRCQLFDPAKKCVSIDGMFYEGAETFLFPELWLDNAMSLPLPDANTAIAMGVDSAQGGDNTSWSVLGNQGLIDLVSKKTPDTSIIPGDTLGLMRQYKIRPEKVAFDAGGGGREHADRLRRMGYNVRTVAFGGGATPEKKRGLTRLEERKLQDEIRYVYKNRRAEMYGMLRIILDLADLAKFALPKKLMMRARGDGGPSLFNQLRPIPLTYDAEGRMYLLPKNKSNADDKKPTLTQLIGCSPDEADSLVLGVFAMLSKGQRSKAKVIKA